MIDTERLHEIFTDCLFQSDEIAADGIPLVPPKIIQGITRQYGLYPERYKKYKDELVSMLEELPDAFKCGISFLQMPFDKNEDQWGEHINCEQLVVLGIANDLIMYPFPKDMWEVLPGGLPYIKIL